ncbi:LOW QUALITY PROTEIN: eukaryotic translation initiation factor 4eb [Stigmatopora argus]
MPQSAYWRGGVPDSRCPSSQPDAAQRACLKRSVTLLRPLQSSVTFPTQICKMATAEPETTPNPSLPEEGGAEQAKETGQEIVSPEAYIKHPLQNKWSLWFFKNDKAKTWQANLRLISKFDTVEDFWALYNHIQLSSNLMSGCDYSLFKDGIEPMWEDERNVRGGRWLITLNKQQRRSDLDRFWLETLLCLVGEAFDDYGDDVCGAVVNIRTKGDKIAVWTSDCQSFDAITHIGRVYKDRLGLPTKMIIGYQSHSDTATKSGSTTKNKFVV